MATDDLMNYSPFVWLAYVLSLPLRVFASIVLKFRRRLYNPEKDVCPGCGFKGDAGTDNKVCRIETRKVMSAEKIALWHCCMRCSAEYWTNCFVPADKWYREPLPPIQRD